MKIAELYAQVTNRIIAELEQGAAPWVKPWKSGRGNGIGLMPANYATGRSYHGINIPILWDAAASRGYERHAWMTFKQALDQGACVRKGEKGTTVVFTKRLRIKDEETDEETTVSMLRTYSVFNVSQIDGLPEPSIDGLIEETSAQKAEKVDGFIAPTGADIRHGGDIACYVPSKDFINLPPFGAFKTPESYYATALHELGHWTGAKARLDRDLSGRFGTHKYAAEELIAELSAAFLCAHLGITGELRHSGYIGNWLKLLKEDNRAIFTAASKASQASDYLCSFTGGSDEADESAAHLAA